MSLVEFFFNSDYRESLQSSRGVSRNNNEPQESEEQKLKRNRKSRKDYHLNTMQRQVDLITSDIIYKFIDKNMVTEPNFVTYLKGLGCQNWAIPVLWERFKKEHNI